MGQRGGVGGSFNWDNDKYWLYAEGLAETSLAHFGDSHALQANPGFRMRW